MKRFLMLALALVLALSLAACGGKDAPAPSDTTSPGASQQQKVPVSSAEASPDTEKPAESNAPEDNASDDVAAFLKNVGFTVEDITPAEGFKTFGLRTYTEYSGEVQVKVEEQTAEQQHALYQQLTEHSRTLSEDGELHDPMSYDTVLEDDTVQDFATGAWSTVWAYLHDGYLFKITFFYFPTGSGGSYTIGFGATEQ